MKMASRKIRHLARIVFEKISGTQWMTINGKRRFYRLRSPYDVAKYGSRLFFFKVNQQNNQNIQFTSDWVDVANAMNGAIIFVCDKKSLKRKIINGCNFKNIESFAFTRSLRQKFSSTVRFISKGSSQRLAAAHLTPFE